MISEAQRTAILKSIDFGDIDGYGDPNLDHYFLDNDYWNKITNEDTFFVAGRKGTGKSAIYRMIEEQSIEKGAIVHNTDFGDYPFNRLLSLSDDGFSRPNQYQSIWRYMIFSDFARLISLYPVEDDFNNRHYQELDQFVRLCLGNSIADLYKELLSRTMKTEIGLSALQISPTIGMEKESTYNLTQCKDISQLNQRLQETLIDYFITCSANRSIFIQFDRLDDNYNSLQKMDDYLCCIASLLKVTYSFNLELRRRRISGARIIVYLRDDILREISKIDAESARWEAFTYFIDWTTTNTHDYSTSELYAMINKRIYASTSDSTLDFDQVFDEEAINLRVRNQQPYNPFRYILERTMHRPRDVIQFCKKIQKEASRKRRLDYSTIKNAEREYCTWLVYEELQNEINPVIDNVDELYQLLRELGQHSFSLNDFYAKTKSFCASQSKMKTPEELARLLYDVGILQNINTSLSGVTRRRASFRNTGPLDKSMKLIIHPGVWRGIND